jgi:hypothetical protein
LIQRAATAGALGLYSSLTIGHHLKVSQVVNGAPIGQIHILLPRAGLDINVAIHHKVNVAVHLDVLLQQVLCKKFFSHVLNDLASEEALRNAGQL